MRDLVGHIENLHHDDILEIAYSYEDTLTIARGVFKKLILIAGVLCVQIQMVNHKKPLNIPVKTINVIKRL